MGSHDDFDTQELIRRAQQGDNEARENLFRRAYPNLFRAAHDRLGDGLRARMDSADLAQTVSHEAFKYLPRYNYQGKGSFHRWLLSILENKIRNRASFFRAKRHDIRREVSIEPAQSVPKSSTNPFQRLIAKEDRGRLEKALGRLPKEYQSVIFDQLLPPTPVARHRPAHRPHRG